MRWRDIFLTIQLNRYLLFSSHVPLCTYTGPFLQPGFAWGISKNCQLLQYQEEITASGSHWNHSFSHRTVDIILCPINSPPSSLLLQMDMSERTALFLNTIFCFYWVLQSLPTAPPCPTRHQLRLLGLISKSPAISLFKREKGWMLLALWETMHLVHNHGLLKHSC